MNFDWNNPPWKGGVTKYRMGLKPVSVDRWFQPISHELEQHKRQLLDTRYHDVVQVVQGSEAAQLALAEHFDLDLGENRYSDVIADLSLQVADDLCLIEAHGEQRLLAASVCSPSYWNVRDKIGRSLAAIHQPVTSLEQKIGEKIARSISNAPEMMPFERVNWFIHGDQMRFHLSSKEVLEGLPENWFVRSERETICRFTTDYALFTINVRFASLKQIEQYPVAQGDLLQSLESFDRDEIEYFGGSDKFNRLKNYLLNLRA